MALAVRKFANYLLVAALVLTPVRATWAFPEGGADLSGHSKILMVMDSDSAVDTECCCAEDACVLINCDPCTSINPVIPAFDYVAGILQIRAHNSSLAGNFDDLKVTPLLHPPRV